MKIVYIAHCIGATTQAGIDQNLADLRRIIRAINLKYDHFVPFAPYYADIVSMDDMIPAERARGILNDTAIIESGIIYEMWLTGPRVSSGMQAEADLAAKMGIPVINCINKI